MLGVLLQSLVHFPAVLADFYLSGLLEEEIVDPDLESDDDEWHSFRQVRARAGAGSQSLGTGGLDASLPHLPTPPHLEEQILREASPLAT